LTAVVSSYNIFLKSIKAGCTIAVQQWTLSTRPPWRFTIARCTIFSCTRSALNLSLNLNWRFRAIKRHA